MQSRRNTKAAMRFMGKLMKHYGVLRVRTYLQLSSSAVTKILSGDGTSVISLPLTTNFLIVA